MIKATIKINSLELAEKKRILTILVNSDRRSCAIRPSIPEISGHRSCGIRPAFLILEFNVFNYAADIATMRGNIIAMFFSLVIYAVDTVYALKRLDFSAVCSLLNC